MVNVEAVVLPVRLHITSVRQKTLEVRVVRSSRPLLSCVDFATRSLPNFLPSQYISVVVISY